MAMEWRLLGSQNAPGGPVSCGVAAIAANVPSYQYRTNDWGTGAAARSAHAALASSCEPAADLSLNSLCP